MKKLALIFCLISTGLFAEVDSIGVNQVPIIDTRIPYKYYNLAGQEVPSNAPGLIIILFEDGTIKKQYNF